MDKVYITGHRNPDTDSIVSAMAYAALKNALGQRQYCAARLGQISDETKAVLDKFGAQPPELINNVRTQVRDLDFDTPPTLSPAATISRAWQMMQADRISVLPVANEDGTLYGMLSAGDVASYDMLSAIPRSRTCRSITCSPFWRERSSTRAARSGMRSPAKSPSPCLRDGKTCCFPLRTASWSAAISRT